MSTPESPDSLLAVTVEVFGETITPATLALAVKLARDACACAKCSPPLPLPGVRALKVSCPTCDARVGRQCDGSLRDAQPIFSVPYTHNARLRAAEGTEPAYGNACLAPEILEALLDRL